MEEGPLHVLEDDHIEVPISAIEHYSYCPRQCALIHVEATFDENLFTIRGRQAHERADQGKSTWEAGVKTVRGLPVWSDRLRIRGKADVVEFRPGGPFPIEYKSGPRRAHHADLQLCAQALCLEEMLGVPVPTGAVFHHAERRQYEVALDDALRQRTLEAIAAIHQMLEAQRVPDAVDDERCPNCSLVLTCMPGVVAQRARVRGLHGALYRVEDVPPAV